MGADERGPGARGPADRPGAIRAIDLGMATAIVGLWLAPWLGRLARPSLLTDDLLRVVVLQRVPPLRRLVLPSKALLGTPIP